jgi:hypothetical protein
MRLTRIMTATPAPRNRLARLATFGAALLVVPLGGLQLAACAGGAPAPTSDALSMAGGVTDGLSLEMTSVDGAPVAVEHVDETLIRLTGPLRIETAEGEYLTDRADIQLASPARGGEPPRVMRVAVLDAEVVRGRFGVPDLYTDEPVLFPDRPVQTGVTVFTLCDGPVMLPELGRLETSCSSAVTPSRQAAEEARSATPLTLEVLPVEGRITTLGAFGPRIDPMTGEEANHTGVDITAPRYTPVVAPAAGRVTFVGWRGGYGRVVELDHGGDVKSRYGHLQLAEVSAGDEVAAGQLIGRVGATGRTTGEHVHWEIWHQGLVYDPAPMIAALEAR